MALNNLQRLICHKTQQTKPKTTDWLFLWYSNEDVQVFLIFFLFPGQDCGEKTLCYAKRFRPFRWSSSGVVLNCWLFEKIVSFIFIRNKLLMGLVHSVRIKFTIFQTTNKLTLPLKMTGEMVESAWVNIVFFSPPSLPGNFKNNKTTWTSLEDHKKEVVRGN